MIAVGWNGSYLIISAPMRDYGCTGMCNRCTWPCCRRPLSKSVPAWGTVSTLPLQAGSEPALLHPDSKGSALPFFSSPLLCYLYLFIYLPGSCVGAQLHEVAQGGVQDRGRVLFLVTGAMYILPKCQQQVDCAKPKRQQVRKVFVGSASSSTL